MGAMPGGAPCRSGFGSSPPAGRRDTLRPIWSLRRRLNRIRSRRLPMLGVNGAGKTCLAWGIGRYLSDSGYGQPSAETASYFYEIDPFMLRNAPIPASVQKQPLVLHVNTVVLRRAGLQREIPVRLVISSHDIPGGELVEMTSALQTPTPHPMGNLLARNFFSFLARADGLIAVVDLARRIRTPEEFDALSPGEREAHLRSALAEQMGPLCRSIETAVQMNPRMRGKPVFFVFTKTDIHRLPVAQARALLHTAYAILLNRLRHHGVEFREHCVAYAGTSRLEDGSISYRIEGVEELLADMALCFAEPP